MLNTEKQSLGDKNGKTVASYRVLPGPEGLLPPAAACCGITLPLEGEGLVEGIIRSEQDTIEEMARQLLTRRNPTIFPGPLVLWAWKDGVTVKADCIMELANEIPGVRIIPMPDYRPIYPKIDPEAVINPCHPNLTIAHNKIEVCVFIGVHCHFANITLKMIRAGTNCYTITLCNEAGHEDSMASLPFCGTDKVEALTNAVRKLKAGGLRPYHADTPGIQLTVAQKAVAAGLKNGN
ncbi:MAG TPA: carbon monoxide dehydrogenase [Bacteroidales bacterium]|nr:carbon monoxide dehydrogenase [Bacteroidales bacterium]